MTNSSTPNTGAEPEQAPKTIAVDEMLVDQIWQEYQDRVSRAQVHLLVAEATREFSEATITTFVPLLIRRHVRRTLAFMVDDTGSEQSEYITFSATSNNMDNDMDSKKGYFPATGHFNLGFKT